MSTAVRAGTIVLALIVPGVFAACSTAPMPVSPSPDPKVESPAKVEPRAAEPIVASSGDIVLDLGDGLDRKSHLLRNKSLACVSQDGAWRVRARDPVARDLSEVHVLVYPPSGGASPFSVHATIGMLGERTNRRLALRIAGAGANIGSGTAVVNDDGTGAMLRIEGRTGEGASLALTVRCASVLRLPTRAGGAR